MENDEEKATNIISSYSSTQTNNQSTNQNIISTHLNHNSTQQQLNQPNQQQNQQEQQIQQQNQIKQEQQQIQYSPQQQQQIQQQTQNPQQQIKQQTKQQKRTNGGRMPRNSTTKNRTINALLPYSPANITQQQSIQQQQIPSMEMVKLCLGGELINVPKILTEKVFFVVFIWFNF